MKKMLKIICVVLVLALTLGAMMIMQANAAEEFTMTPIEFVSKINCGINIGNSLDTWPGGNETEWGNPMVTKKLITTIKERGFNAIRIPVTWYKMIGDKASGYTVNATWMRRAKQVVDYAYDQGLIVVLNMHHEGDWCKPIFYTKEGAEDKAAFDEMLVKYASLWTQISNTFKDYGERLIFESHNEIRDGNNWSGYYDCYVNFNRLNKTFVDTVRATGGNNAKRYLTIKAYASNSDSMSLKQFVVPADPANHLIFDYHSYAPQSFCFGENAKTDFTDADAASLKADIEKTAQRLKTMFLDNGVAVICSEWGSVDKSAKNPDNPGYRVKHAETYYQTLCENGIKGFWWDSGGNFSLIDRSTYEWNADAIVEKILTIGNKYVGFMLGNPSATLTPVPTTTGIELPVIDPTGIEVKYGDVNNDNSINSKDVLQLRKFVAKQKVSVDTAAADVVKDGSLNSKDVLLLRKYIAKQKVELGKEPN